MRHRSTDDSNANGATVKITREIPLWGILTVCGALAGQGISTYYGQLRLDAGMEKLSADVRIMTTELTSLSRAQASMQFRAEALERRIDVLERRADSVPTAKR